VERRDRGDNEEAARDLDAAARLFDEAAEIGRSDSALYEGSAEARIRRLEMNVISGATPGGDYQGAVDRCAKAALARPDRSEPYTEMAFAYYFQAKQAQGEEARRLLGKQLAAAERALAIGGGDFATYERLSGAQQMLGLDEMEHGLDPHRSIEAAIANARRAIAVSPSHPWGHVALADSHFYRGLVKMKAGVDPSADFSATVAECRAATDLDRGYVIGYANLLDVYVHLAWWSVERGEDPAAATRDAADVFAHCVQVNPRHGECFENAGGIDAWRAAYQVLAGLDAGEALSRAGENLEKAAGFLKNLENRQRLGHVHLLRTEDTLRRGEDPKAAFAALGDAVADCYRAGATDPLCTLLDAQQALLVAGSEGKQRRPERPALERARSLAATAVDRNDHDADAHQVLAHAEERLAALAGPRAEQDKHRAAGLLSCARGLARNPNHPRLLGRRGALLLLQAHAIAETERPAIALQARDALRRAVTLNPLLRREFGGAIAEAKLLAGEG
jgi:serine/threonine-protein kinase